MAYVDKKDEKGQKEKSCLRDGKILTSPEYQIGASRRDWRWTCVLCDKYYALTENGPYSYTKRKLKIRERVSLLLTTSKELAGGKQWFTGLKASDAKYLCISFERLKFIRIPFVMQYKEKRYLKGWISVIAKFKLPESDLVLMVKSKIVCMLR